MKVALFQTDIIWKNPQANRTILNDKILSLPEAIDLIVLPEMFTTGFTMHLESCAESMNETTLSWMKDLAKLKDVAITGSLPIFEKGKYYNRMVFVYPNAEVKYYDKRHLFSLAGENKKFAKGALKQTIAYSNFKICLQICYDLRFPVFSRNVEGYDVLIYVANWPHKRIQAWDILLKARAVENLCYVIGVNRVGVDGNKLEYNGHTQVVDFSGDHLLQPQEKEGVFIIDLDKEQLFNFREKFPFLNDKDGFILE
jgi:omega-amidase